jgi:hypothetical protein
MEESRNSEERPGGRGFWKFWATLPGILTGVSALLTATVGIGTAWQSLTKDDGSAGSVPAGDRPGVATTVGSSSREDEPAGVLAQGRITMKDADFADLEAGRVGGPDNDDLFLNGTEELLGSYGTAPTPGPADKDECVAALTARQDSLVRLDEIDPGMWLCLQTDVGHVAVLEIVEPASVGNPRVVFAYTVWR